MTTRKWFDVYHGETYGLIRADHGLVNQLESWLAAEGVFNLGLARILINISGGVDRLGVRIRPGDGNVDIVETGLLVVV